MNRKRMFRIQLLLVTCMLFSNHLIYAATEGRNVSSDIIPWIVVAALIVLFIPLLFHIKKLQGQSLEYVTKALSAKDQVDYKDKCIEEKSKELVAKENELAAKNAELNNLKVLFEEEEEKQAH